MSLLIFNGSPISDTSNIASKVKYDNSAGGFISTDVQSAIDELARKIKLLASGDNINAKPAVVYLEQNLYLSNDIGGLI